MLGTGTMGTVEGGPLDLADTEAVRRRWEHAVQLGHGDEDMAAPYLGQRAG